MPRLLRIVGKYFSGEAHKPVYSDILSKGQPETVSEAFAAAEKAAQTYTPTIFEDIERNAGKTDSKLTIREPA